MMEHNLSVWGLMVYSIGVKVKCLKGSNREDVRPSNTSSWELEVKK